MKKVLTAVLALSISLASIAQSKLENQKHDKGQKKEHFKKGDYTSKLNLTDQQKTQVKTLNENFRTQMKDLHNNGSITVDAQREKRQALTQQHEQAIKNILTPEQRKQAEELKKSAGFKGKQKGEGRFNEMQKDLNLSADQNEKLKTMNENFRKQMQDLRSNASLTEDQKKEQIKTLSKEHKEHVSSILTSEQKAKMKNQLKRGKSVK